MNRGIMCRRILACVLLLLVVGCAAAGALNRNFLDEATADEEAAALSNVNHSPYIKHREFKTKNKEDVYFDKSFLHLSYCRRTAKCHNLNYTTCMGAKLPYHTTTLDLTDLDSQEKVQEKLQLYQYIRFIPKCWAVIQPFLCALYMPKCDNELVDLPSREMCKVTLEPCKILYNTSWFPNFFNCEDQRLFPPKCKNDIHDLKFNTTGLCMDPLTKTDHPDWFYPDVEGCGLRCKDSLYTEYEHYQIHKLIAYCVLVCIAMNLFTSMTFVIDWKTANKYPALAIFYVNLCFSISYFGWLVQFLGNDTREDVVCKKDGTLRKSEPSASENLSCVIVFVMVYYFFVAGLVWFVIFCYAWHQSCLQALGKIQERVEKKRAYFHLMAWSLPLILTITTMAIGEIDGDYVTGICFVGFVNRTARAGLLLTPLAAAMLGSGFIIIKGLILLTRVRMESQEIISDHSSRKIRSNIVRMGVFTIFMVVFCVITFGYHHYITMNRDSWTESLNSFIICKLTSLSTDYSHCKQEMRPSVAMLQLQLLAVFGTGVAMASWVWCNATLHSWSRYLRKKFNCHQEEEQMKVQKHKIIAQAFAKRKIFNQGGKISINCDNRTDPVGLKFALNSAESSNELSTTWAAHLPRLVNRRGAVPNEVTYSVSSNNQSIDSEVSLNVRHVSIESRRNSGDSQLSVQIAELKARRKVNGRRHGRMRHNNKYRTNSKSSTTSNILSAIAAPNLSSRRAGNAGLSDFVTEAFFQARDFSEDENVSLTVSESKFNVRHNQSMDLNDRLVINSISRGGVQIEELRATSSDSDKDRDQEKLRKKKKKRRHFSNDDDDDDDDDDDEDDSSCPEIERLGIMMSSLNSGVSEKNRASRQSKNSTDVAVQTNAQDILTTMSEELNVGKVKTKQAKTKENKKCKNNNKTLCDKKRDMYNKYGSSEEKIALKYRDSDDYLNM